MNTALLVVDVQCGFINSYTEHLPKKINTLFSKYKHIFCTQFFNPENSFYRKLIRWDQISKDSNDFKLAYQPPSHATILEKDIYSCVNKKFLQTLKEKNIEEVHICGIDTDICVLKCAVDLIESGLSPKVLVSYCGSSADEELHKAAVKILERFIGKEQVINGNL